MFEPWGRRSAAKIICALRETAPSIYSDDGAKLDDLHAAVTTLEEVARIARRVLGGTHPLTVDIEDELQNA